MNKIPPAWKEEGKKLGKEALKGALNNWGFKLLALFLSVVLWAGLISQDPTLTREKTFTGVTINLANTETIKRNGFIVVTDMSELLNNATLEVDVPQMQYDTAQASYYNARIDLSRITQTGVQEVKVTATNSGTYGTVKEIVPATVQIEVEDYITRYRIPTSVEVTGELPEGFYATTPSRDPPIVAISGPRSLVEKVVRAKVELDLSTLPHQEGQVRTAAPISLVDINGDVIESDLVEITSESVLLDSVILEQQIYLAKTLPLSDMGLLSGEPAEGYEVKSVTMTPDVITVAARTAVLEELPTIYPEGSVNISNLSKSFTQQLRVRKPSELAYLSSDSVTVAVEIGPIISEKTFNNVKVKTTGVESGLKAEVSLKEAGVVIQGPVLWVDKLRSSDITLHCDLSGLGVGDHQVQVACVVKDSDGQPYNVEIQPGIVTVHITAK